MESTNQNHWLAMMGYWGILTNLVTLKFSKCNSLD